VGYDFAVTSDAGAWNFAAAAVEWGRDWEGLNGPESSRAALCIGVVSS
jgi:hypothetical protein